MRNKKWFARADWILWTFISILPLIAYLIYLSNGDVVHSGATFNQFMTGFGIGTINNVFASVFQSLFNTNGVFPLFATTSTNLGIFYFLTYFTSVHILHLAVDFLLFIPRLAHKLMDGFLGGD